jgi:hypothetical protein
LADNKWPRKPQRPRRRRTDGVDRGAYRTLRTLLRQKCIAERAECHFGDGPIEWGLTHPDPGSFTVHHTIAVAARPDLEMEVSLWRPAHLRCNQADMAAYDVDGAGAYVEPGSENDGFGLPFEAW